MKKMVFKIFCCFMVLILALTVLSGCNAKKITKSEAYNIYYDTIKTFLPELMDKSNPLESDVDITVREEFFWVSDWWTKNKSINIQSQNVDGKLQYFLVEKDLDKNICYANVIKNDEYLRLSNNPDSIAKGDAFTYTADGMNDKLLVKINTPLFPRDAISSFKAKKQGSDTVLTFKIKGDKTDPDFGHRVMIEITPERGTDQLDDITLVLTIDENGVPKTMFVEMSMHIFRDDMEDVLFEARKVRADYTFNKLKDVDFDIDNLIAEYAAELARKQGKRIQDSNAGDGSVS